MHHTIAHAVSIWNDTFGPQLNTIDDARDFAYWLIEGRQGDHNRGVPILNNPDISVSAPEDQWLIATTDVFDAGRRYLDDLAEFADEDAPDTKYAPGTIERAMVEEYGVDPDLAAHICNVMSDFYEQDDIIDEPDNGLTAVDCAMLLDVKAEFHIEQGYADVRNEVHVMVQDALSELQRTIDEGLEDILQSHDLEQMDMVVNKELHKTN